MINKLNYSIWAKYYDLLNKQDINHLARKIYVNIIENKINNSDKINVLDLGCGTGELLFQLSVLNKKLNCVGVDLSEKMLNRAKEKKRDIKFMLSDIVRYKSNKKFDLILSTNDALNYICPSDLNLFFDNLYELCKKDSIIYFDFDTELDIKNYWDGQINEINFLNLSLKRKFTFNKDKNIGIEYQTWEIKNKNKIDTFYEKHTLYPINQNQLIEIANMYDFKLVSFINPITFEKIFNSNNFIRLGCLLAINN